MKNKTLQKLKTQFGLTSVKGESISELLENIQKAPKGKKEQYEAGAMELIDYVRSSRPQQAPQQLPEQDGQSQQFNEGGDLKKKSAFGEMDNAGKAGAIAGDAGLALKFAQDAFGDTGIVSDGSEGRMERTTGSGWAAAGAGLEGAAAGAKYGPLGAAIGGVIGVGSSLIGSGKEKKAQDEANNNAALVESNQFRNTFADGGNLRTNRPVMGDCGGPGQPPCTDTTNIHIPMTPVGGVGGTSNPLLEPEVKPVERLGYPAGMQPLDAGADMSLSPSGNRPLIPATAPAMTSEAPAPSAATPNIPRSYQSYPSSKSQISAPAAFPQEPVVAGNPYGPQSYGAYESQPQVNDNAYYNNDPEGVLRPTPTATATRQHEYTAGNLIDKEAVDKALNPMPSADLAAYEADAAVQENQSFLDEQKSYIQDTYQHVDNPDANPNDQNTQKRFQPQELLRYAPVIGNAVNLLTAPGAETETYDRLDSRYKHQYVDERMLENRVSQSAANTRSAIQNASGGSQAAARASLLGSQVNETRGLSEAMAQAQGANRAENAAGQQFNLGVDQYNQQVDQAETIANVQNADNARDYKRSLMQSLLNDAGAIGKESTQRRILKNMSGYNSDGTKGKSGWDLSALLGNNPDEDDPTMATLRKIMAED